jgi:hypothetical protein
MRGIEWAVLCGISPYLRGDTEGRGVVLQSNHEYF